MEFILNNQTTTILIVDDRPENLFALEAVLRKENYIIEKAYSGKEAIEKVLKFDFDCILLDVQMPGMDGFEVAEILSSNDETKSIPIIFVTALSKEKEFMLKGYKTGAVEYLNKPLDPDILKIKVETFSQLHKQKKEIQRSHNETKRVNSVLEDFSIDMNASIRYAKNIQNAILPKEETFHSIFPDSFVYYKPKDIVGGDFYWLSVTRGKIIIACGDCTGHGVPGALMTMVGQNLLKQAVEVKQLATPADILADINKELKNTFHHNNLGGNIADGMEMGICCFDMSSNALVFSGARMPLLMIKDGMPVLVKGDSHGLSNHSPVETVFTNHEYQLTKNDCLYMFSDGYADQFGGNNDKRFTKKNLFQTLSFLMKENMETQKEKLSQVFDDWKGEQAQVDDVLVIGIRI